MAAHSALVPRRLNGGSIAGAVVGSVVGFLLILLCIVPFVLRARRRRRFARDGAADDQAEMGHSPSDGGRSSPPHVDDSNESKVDKPGHPTGHYPTPDSSTTGNGHDVNNKAHSDHSTQHSPTQPGLSLDNGLPLPLASPPAHPLPQPIAQAPSASPADQPTPPPTEVPSRDHSSLPSNVSKQGTRDLSVTDSYGPPSRELTGITTAGLTQEPESFEHPSHPTAHRRFSHISGSIRSLLHRRRDSQQRQQSKHSTLGGTDGARSPSVCTTEAFGQPDLPQPVLEEPFGQPSLPEPAFEADTTAQGLAWSYYNDPNLIPYSSTPAPANLFPPVPETTQAPLSPISLPDQQPLGSGVAVPPFMIGQNVVEEPYDIFPDAATAAATPRPYAPRTSLLRGPSGTLTRTDSLPPLQPIYSDIGGASFEAPLQPSGVPMYIFGPPTNEAESAHHLQHEMSRMSSSPRAPEHIEFPEPSEEVKAFLNNPIQNPMDLSSPHNGINSTPFNGPLTQGDMTLDGPLIQDDLDFNAPFIKNDPGSAHMTPYNSPPNLSVNGQDFSEVNYNTNLMGGQPLDPQVMANYPSYYTPPPSTGPSVQNTPETRLSEYTSSPSPRYDMSQSPLPPVDPPSVKYKCNQCDRSFEQIHKLNHHKRYHDRPHECTHPGCSMKFGTKTHLDRHVNDKHNKTRKFHCTQADCPYSKQGGKSFPRKDNWRRHMVNKHTITPDHDPIECNDETMLGT